MSNTRIKKLYQISQKPSREIIGLMSGTSLDGLDIAHCRISGAGETTSVELLHFVTEPYDEGVKDAIREVFAKQMVDFQALTLLNAWIGRRHAEMVNRALAHWRVGAEEIDLIASHGQTVFHAPRSQHGLEDMPNATLQIGDADHIAVGTGIITVGDFRQKHIAAGGEGAPLAVYGDRLIFSEPREHRLLLNIGGIANFTWLPAGEDQRGVFATDTGPGNTLLDAYTRYYFPAQSYDADGYLASRGTAIPELLTELKNHPFFNAPFPKTTGPELFNPAYVQEALFRAGVHDPTPYDVLATLTQFTAETIASAIFKTVGEGDFVVYVSGGGAHNPMIMSYLKIFFRNIFPLDKLGISGDAKEAVLFAVLANETVAGTGALHGLSKEIPTVSMGKISFPT